jgi:hypothetical protein
MATRDPAVWTTRVRAARSPAALHRARSRRGRIARRADLTPGRRAPARLWRVCRRCRARAVVLTRRKLHLFWQRECGSRCSPFQLLRPARRQDKRQVPTPMFVRAMMSDRSFATPSPAIAWTCFALTVHALACARASDHAQAASHAPAAARDGASDGAAPTPISSARPDGSAGAPGPSEPLWTDVDVDGACARAARLTPPSADEPTPVERKSLVGCDAEALYYGIGAPPDYEKARKCAYTQLGRNREVTDADVFSGPAILMMIYANGKGVAVLSDLALTFACQVFSARAELEGRVARLVGRRPEDQQGKDFDVCDDITSGFMDGFCAAHAERIVAPVRVLRKRRAEGGLPATELGALDRAATAFFDARETNEVDLTGTSRAAFQIEERASLEDGYVEALERIRGPDLPSPGGRVCPRGRGAQRGLHAHHVGEGQGALDGNRHTGGGPGHGALVAPISRCLGRLRSEGAARRSRRCVEGLADQGAVRDAPQVHGRRLTSAASTVSKESDAPLWSARSRRSEPAWMLEPPFNCCSQPETDEVSAPAPPQRKVPGARTQPRMIRIRMVRLYAIDRGPNGCHAEDAFRRSQSRRYSARSLASTRW